MKRLSLLLVLLVTGAAQGQTLYTCGSKHADPKHCLPVNLCVTSNVTHKTYCGATLGAAEAQEMSHEKTVYCTNDGDFGHTTNCYSTDGAVAYSINGSSPCTVQDTSGCVGGGAYPPLLYLDHVSIYRDIRYCDQVPGKDAGAECVQRAVRVAPKGGLVIHYKASDIKPGSACPSGMHWAESSPAEDEFEREEDAYFKAHPKEKTKWDGTFIGSMTSASNEPYYFCERNK